MRTGKIARMPKGVRDELNQRLEDGEPGVRLVEWLNGRVDVQEVLKAHFYGQPISEQNLSRWTQDGFEEWRRQEASLGAVHGLVEESTGARELAGDRGMSDRVADVAAVALGELLMAARRMPDGPEKQRSILKIVRSLVRLRKAERDHEKSLREAGQAERGAEFHRDCVERVRRQREEADEEKARRQREEAEQEAWIAAQRAAGYNGEDDEEDEDEDEGPPAPGGLPPSHPSYGEARRRGSLRLEDGGAQRTENGGLRTEDPAAGEGEPAAAGKSDGANERLSTSKSTSTSTNMSMSVRAEAEGAAPPCPEGITVNQSKSQ